MKIIVDISDGRVSNNQNDELITYSLGSCIGATLYDPERKIGAMLHCQLPSGRLDPDKARKNPMMFADTGMTKLIEHMEHLGANRKRMQVKLAGGAQVMNDAKIFKIGKRNYAAVRQILWKNGMFIDAEDVGGESARNLSLQISNGTVSIKSQGLTKQL